MWTTHPTERAKSYDGQSKLIDIIQCNSLLRTLSDDTIDHIGCNYCHCSYAHKSAICSSKFLKITNMPPIASLQFTHLAFCAGTNKNRRNSFPLLVDNFYFVGDIRRQSQTSPQQFTASTSQFASTKMSQASVQLFAVPNSKSTLQSSLRTESHQNKCYWSEPTSTMYGRKIVNALFSAWTTNPPT